MKKTDKLPKSAMALYVKLYRKRKDRSKNRQFNLMEATKSWVSLSKTDKQYFFDVFKEYETKVKKYVASNLQNAQLYMKKHSYAKRSSKSKEVTVDCNHHSYEDREVPKENGFLNCQNNDEKNEIEIQQHNKQFENYSTTAIPDSVKCVNLEPNMVKPDMSKYISEPTPPIRSSMELFEIIKNSEETTQNINWADLTKSQKKKYQIAVLSIKNNYLKQYIAYLEQLPPNKLLHYYNSKC